MTSWSRSTRCPRAPSAPRASTRWPPSRSGSSASSARGSAAACPRASRCSRCSSSATTASTPCTTCTSSPSTAGRWRRPTTGSTSTPRTWSAPSARIDELAAESGLSRLLDGLVADRPAEPRGRRRPVPALAGPPGRPGGGVRAPVAAAGADAVRGPGAAGRRRASCPTTSVRSATSPSAPRRTARWTRTGRCATCTRWSAGGSTCGGFATSSSPGSRHPRTSCCCTPSPRATPRTSASWPWPRCASWWSCATRPARSPPCRTSSVPWPTASRRSVGPGPRSAPGPGSTPTTSGCTSGHRSRPTSTS